METAVVAILAPATSMLRGGWACAIAVAHRCAPTTDPRNGEALLVDQVLGRCAGSPKCRAVRRPSPWAAGKAPALGAALLGQASSPAQGPVRGAAPFLGRQADAWLRISNVVSSGGVVKPPSMPACMRGISVPSRNRSQLSCES